MAENYRINVANPALGLQTFGNLAMAGMEAKKQREVTAEDEKAMAEFAEKFPEMTPVEIGQYVLKNPRVSKFLVSSIDVTNKMTKEENLRDAIELAQAYITGEAPEQEQVGQAPIQAPDQAPAQPVGQPAMRPPSIGLESAPVIPMTPTPTPVPSAPAMPPSGITPVDGQVSTTAQPEGVAPTGKDAAVKVLTAHAEEALARGADTKESIELTRDAMTGGDKAFKGAMAFIAAHDPQAFDRLMKLQYGEATPSTDIDDYVSRANEESIRVTGEPLTPGERNEKALEFKRMQAGEARTVTTAKKEAELDVIKDMQPGIERDKAISVYQAKQEETRNQDAIDKGIMAAESMPNIKRGLDLLNGIQTGGIDNVALAAKRFFGVEGADEGELSNRLAKAVLSQLRDTFGAQFTEGEGQRLIRIEAGFDKSPENNERLLKQALLMAQGKVDVALKIAEAKGDQAAIDQIQSWTGFDLGAGGAPPKEITTQAEYDALQPGAFYLEDGVKYQKPGGQ